MTPPAKDDDDGLSPLIREELRRHDAERKERDPVNQYRTICGYLLGITLLLLYIAYRLTPAAQ